jgi:hypothetical protein
MSPKQLTAEEEAEMRQEYRAVFGKPYPDPGKRRVSTWSEDWASLEEAARSASWKALKLTASCAALVLAIIFWRVALVTGLVAFILYRSGWFRR